MWGQRIWLGIGMAGVLAARPADGADSIRAAPPFSPAPTSARLKVFGAARAPEARRVTAARLDGALPLRRRPVAGSRA